MKNVDAKDQDSLEIDDIDEEDDYQISCLENTMVSNSNNTQLLYWLRFRSFVAAPKVHFVYDSISFIVFLAFFSHFLLYKFPAEEKDGKISYRGSFSEIVVIIFVFTFILEEIVRVRILE